jgi:hypothetical protein
MNILLLASHAVAEFDDLRMFIDLGYDVFAPGGYEVPSRSGEGIRPALSLSAPHHPEFVAMCHAIRAERGEPGPYIDWAKAHIPDPIIDWADAIIVHHFPEAWIGAQWPRIKHKRVIWRTCGQSDPRLEQAMTPFVADGLQVVRYSPAERRYFERVGAFAGEHALIRFGKYPADYGPWTGTLERVGNITQNMPQRGDACGYAFWEAATEGLPVAPAGPGSETMRGGIGTLSYERMLTYLRTIRVYLYTGTRPASYTLGLIEAMMSGVPVVSIGARAWGDEWGGADLFEAATSDGREMPSIVALDSAFDDPIEARRALRVLLDYPDKADVVSRGTRTRAIGLFDVAKVGAQWREFLA